MSQQEQSAVAAVTLPKIPSWDTDTLHVGADELDYVTIAEGVEVKVVHVDLNQGIWIVFNRFHPGAKVPAHYHSGQVYAVTLEGRWSYKESPEAVNEPGSYLFEPAGCTHTIEIPQDQEGPTVVWFAVHGVNVQLQDDGELDMVVDARTMLEGYRMLLGAMGKPAPKTLVFGE
ncbi:cupin [Pseudohalioglobus sediminis]|uniref:Cupin n=1 Tax=Pseudohalioglobus sediminis TaxID=2606449 RepID=A0A5B0WZL8_9GAMM|nr:2,4'-dihydroxyacetophenone dioxygenase family protein [Pseudohalioglobus sediminis]KAA1192502.1 cupin [Pseudohalioglobus sediminis]